MRPRPEKSPTEAAKVLLREGFYPRQIAKLTGLHVAYVRKIRQRAAGRDKSHHRWRETNPKRVRAYNRAASNRRYRAKRRLLA